MKIVFMGTPQFAVPSLSALIAGGYDIPAVVTASDKPKGRGLGVSESEIKKYAASSSLRILQPEKLKSPWFIDTLKEISPDLIVIVAFRVLPEAVFTLPRFGSVNLHASLLPKYRGAAPINRAIMNGETETGVTTFFLKKEVDTGSIILQRKVSIEENDNAGVLHDKLSLTGAELLLETVRKIDSGVEFELLHQDDTIATSAPKIFRDDCIINWHRTSKEIHNQIRGLSPYPGAFSVLDGKIFKIYDSRMGNDKSDYEPGRIMIEGKRVFAGTADGLVELCTVQLEGKKRMSAEEFIAGRKDLKGKRFSTG